MQVTIDRFEGRFAVVETEKNQTVDMPRELVPAEAKEGDILTIRVDQELTRCRRAELEKLKRKLTPSAK